MNVIAVTKIPHDWERYDVQVVLEMENAKYDALANNEAMSEEEANDFIEGYINYHDLKKLTIFRSGNAINIEYVCGKIDKAFIGVDSDGDRNYLYSVWLDNFADYYVDLVDTKGTNVAEVEEYLEETFQRKMF